MPAWDESTNPEYSKRLLRGHQMIERGIEPSQVAFNQFAVPSQSKDLNYIVTLHAGTWSCNCPDYEFRHVTCKHIHCVVLWQRLSKKIEEAHKEKSVFAVALRGGISCKFCGSSKIIKYGKANNKQVYPDLPDQVGT